MIFTKGKIKNKKNLGNKIWPQEGPNKSSKKKKKPAYNKEYLLPFV